MRILRLFVNQDLSSPLNWVLVEEDGGVSSGTSTFLELAKFEEGQLEVFIDVNCCSIFKTSVAGISTKKLTDELVLGMLEERLADDIEDVKPIILRVEDDIAYIAILNKIFYTDLIEKLLTLNKPIRLIESFAYATLFEEGSWTVFLSQEQQFVRTSRYEYYLLDETTPIPLTLEEMLKTNNPQGLLLYSDRSEVQNYLEHKLDLTVRLVNNQFNFDDIVWNFHNEKSTKFQIKLDTTAKSSLKHLIQTAKYAAIFIVAFWFLNLIAYTIDSHKIKQEVQSQLGSILPVGTINYATLKMAANKIDQLKHAHGIYANSDAIALFNTFLSIISDIDTNTITQVSYGNGQLNVFLSQSFDTSQFGSYVNILKTQHITATIQDYKTYASQAQASSGSSGQGSDDSSSQGGGLTSQPQISDDTAWVVTLQAGLAAQAQPTHI